MTSGRWATAAWVLLLATLLALFAASCVDTRHVLEVCVPFDSIVVRGDSAVVVYRVPCQ